MKVCFYCGVFARQGGIEEFTRDLALTLRKADVEVRIVCASLHNPLLDELKQAGVEVVAVPVFVGCRWNIPDYALLPCALVKLRDADIVIHQKPFKDWFYRMLPRTPKHVFLTAYHPADQFPRDRRGSRFFDFFDHVITQTEAFKADILARGVTKEVSVVPLLTPVSVAAAQVRTDSQRMFRFGMMGRIEPQKNHAYAIRVVHEFQKLYSSSYSGIELHIYGAGILEQEVGDLARTLDVTAVFHGVYRRNTVPEIVAENDLFLITSVSEGQCIVALEILSCGRPLFACPVGALPDVLQDEQRGRLLSPDDAQSAAKSISGWLTEHVDSSPADIQASYARSYNRDLIEARYLELLTRIGGTA